MWLFSVLLFLDLCYFQKSLFLNGHLKPSRVLQPSHSQKKPKTKLDSIPPSIWTCFVIVLGRYRGPGGTLRLSVLSIRNKKDVVKIYHPACHIGACDPSIGPVANQPAQRAFSYKVPSAESSWPPSPVPSHFWKGLRADLRRDLAWVRSQGRHTFAETATMFGLPKKALATQTGAQSLIVR